MKKKRVVIVDRFRFTMFLTLVSLIFIILIGIGLNFGKVYSTTYNGYYEVRVKKSDTLWKIASENNPNNEDIRRVIYRIKQINNLDDCFIKEGDIVKIPSKEE